jgi:hypothetical protein
MLAETTAGPHTFEVTADKPNLLVEPEPHLDRLGGAVNLRLQDGHG